MPNPSVEIVARALTRFGNFYREKPDFFPGYQNLYPIPFFGDIRRATVLTLALNPAWTEFRHSRHWIPGLDSWALTTRLLHYFDLPTPPPHRWFGDRREALALLDCSYETNSAHIDLHPLPIKFRPDLTELQRTTIGKAIETRSAIHLASLLKLATQVRLLLVVDYTFSKSDGVPTKTYDFISTHKPIVELLSPIENRLKVFSAGGTNQFLDRIRNNRSSLCAHLRRRLS